MNLEKLKTAGQVAALFAFAYWMLAEGSYQMMRMGFLDWAL